MSGLEEFLRSPIETQRPCSDAPYQLTVELNGLIHFPCLLLQIDSHDTELVSFKKACNLECLGFNAELFLVFIKILTLYRAVFVCELSN